MKRVIITGVSKGLGRHIAEVFVGAVWQVTGTGRSPKPSNINDLIDYHQFDASDNSESENFWKNLSFHKDDIICLYISTCDLNPF